MGKSKRTVNPADALRKKQRRRELLKNKEDRKRVRESQLAKKDVGKLQQDISRLEHLASTSQLDSLGKSRLEGLKDELAKVEKAKKATGLTGAQAAYAARMQEQEKKNETEGRKLVYDPKKGAFVPAKKKASSSNKADGSESESGSDSESSGSSDSESDDDINMSGSDIDEEIPIPEEPQPAHAKALTESDDDYEIPLPPGPPPTRPFHDQFQKSTTSHINDLIVDNINNRIPPPPPPGGPPPPHANYMMIHPPPPMMINGRIPPPPPPLPHGFQPHYPPPSYPNMTYYAPRPPVTATAAHYSAPVNYNHPATSVSAKPITTVPAQPTISAEPQLRDLQKELTGFVPAALRRKQLAAKKKEMLPKVARPNINAAPDFEE